MALQKDAILNDNWEPYINNQIEQGIIYARMGLDFRSWYEVVALFRNYLSGSRRRSAKPSGCCASAFRR
jgi:hypothetical protein